MNDELLITDERADVLNAIHKGLSGEEILRGGYNIGSSD